MLKLLLTVIILSQCTFCYSQAELNKDTSNYKHSPVYVLKTNNKLWNSETRNPVINSNDITAYHVIIKDTTKNYLGQETRNTTIYLTIKPNTPLIDFRHLLKEFHIPLKDSSLTVFIDNFIDCKPRTRYFQLSAVKLVEVREEVNTHLRYINIISVDPMRKPKTAGI